MRIGTVDGRTALLDEGAFEDVATASEGRLPSDAVALLERWDDLLAWAGSSQRRWSALDPARLGPPVPFPRQVFALMANYRDHAAEAGLEVPEHPTVFTKFPTCITGPYDDVVLSGNRCDWEVELVVVVGRRAHQVPADQAWSHVAGLMVGQDISDRRVQFRKPPPHLALAKSFPTFGPTGPWFVTTDELPDPDALTLRCSVNGEQVQHASTRDLVFPVPALIAALSAVLPLLPGDLVFTGTPAGVGSTRDPRRYLAPGDVITSELEGVGTMRNRCV